jgi:hypothetical protein
MSGLAPQMAATPRGLQKKLSLASQDVRFTEKTCLTGGMGIESSEYGE